MRLKREPGREPGVALVPVVEGPPHIPARARQHLAPVGVVGDTVLVEVIVPGWNGDAGPDLEGLHQALELGIVAEAEGSSVPEQDVDGLVLGVPGGKTVVVVRPVLDVPVGSELADETVPARAQGEGVVELVIAGVGARNEAHFGPEVLTGIGKEELGGPEPIVPFRGDLPVMVVAVEPGGLGAGEERGHRELLQELEVQVHTVGPVIVSGRPSITVEDDGPKIRVLQDVAADAGHREVVGGGSLKLLLLDVQKSQDKAPGPTRKAGSSQEREHPPLRRQADAPAVEELGVLAPGCPSFCTHVAKPEHPGVLEEEVPLLGKEEAEAREVDLLGVHLYLGEVGIVGQVRRDALCDPVLQVQPRLGVEVILADRAGPLLVEAGGNEGLDPQVPPPADLIEALQNSGQGNVKRVETARHQAPVKILTLAPDAALEVDPHDEIAPRTESKCLEGNGHLHAPAVLLHPCGRVPDAVPLQIGDPPVVKTLAVVLSGGGVGKEGEPVAVVVEGIEGDAEDIAFPAGEVALQLVDDDPVGFRVVAVDAEVEVVVVKEDADLRPLRGGRPLVRVGLNETGHRNGQGPVGFLQLPVELDGLVGPAGGDGLFFRLGGDRDCGRRPGQHKDEKSRLGPAPGHTATMWMSPFSHGIREHYHTGKPQTMATGWAADV